MCQQHLSPDEQGARPRGPASFVDELVVALTNARIYSEQHPRVRASAELLHAGLRELVAEGGGAAVQIGAADGFLFHGGRPLLGASLAARRLVDVLEALGAGGVELAGTATLEEVTAFVRFVSRESKGVERYDIANLALDRQGCRAVRFLPPYCDAQGSHRADDRVDWAGRLAEALPAVSTTVDLDADIALPSRLYQGVVATLQDGMVQAVAGNSVDTTSAAGHVESILEQLSREPTSLMRLARYEKYDEFTFGHSIRVSLVALNFARHLTSDTRLLHRIGLAALLHDIGKAWVPFEVLHSQARLSEVERGEMNMHPVHGGQILLDSSEPDPMAVAVAFSHHQNQDGTGYPRTVRLSPPSAASMIVKLADVYEALTAVRPYKPRMSPTRAYRIMLDMQGHFDPVLLRRFIEVNGIYPVGSRVRLSTGEVARVEQLTDSPLEPLVRTEQAACGQGLFYEDTQVLDLRERFGRNRISVESVLLDAEVV